MFCRFAPVLVALIAQGAPAQKTVEVLCVDLGGKPVAGAEVWVFQRQGQGSYVPFGPYTSDAEGRTRCPTALTYDGGMWSRFLYARLPGKLVGFPHSFHTAFGQLNAESPVPVRMHPTRTVEGLVRVPEGFEVTEVRVRVHSLVVTKGPDGEKTFESFPRNSRFRGLDKALPEIFECAVDADGAFTVLDVPADGLFYLMAEAPGLGHAQFANVPRPGDVQEDVVIEMAREAVLHGRVVDPKGQPVADATVRARIADSSQATWVLETFDSRTDARGRFRIGGLPGVDLDVHVTHERESWVFLPLRTAAIAGGEKEIELALEVGTRVAGRVVDPESKPLTGARVTAVSQGGIYDAIVTIPCDDEGRFELLLPDGWLEVYVSFAPEGYLPGGEQDLRVRKGQPVEDLVLELRKR